MVHTGGGAEEHARSKQYDYRANSNQVVAPDSRPGNTDVSSGEAESLSGKIDPKKFGDRAYRGRPSEHDEELHNSKKRRKEIEPMLLQQRKKRQLQDESVLNPSDEGIYKPKARESSAAYEAMLSIIQQQLGGQPLNVVYSAADEILAILKNEGISTDDKRMKLEKLLNAVPDNVFHQLVSIEKLITDYHHMGSDADGPSEGNGDDDPYSDIGISVEFGGDGDAEEESGHDIVSEDEEEDDVIEGIAEGDC